MSRGFLLHLIFFLFCIAAYEQAFQLAETDADRSCVITALGMLGYALNDKDAAKAMLFKRFAKRCDNTD